MDDDFAEATAYDDGWCDGQKDAQKELSALRAEIERLRFLIHNAGMSFRDHWAIDWEPIMSITDEVTAMCEKNYFALADKGEE
jgi:hypothetical protein